MDLYFWNLWFPHFSGLLIIMRLLLHSTLIVDNLAGYYMHSYSLGGNVDCFLFVLFVIMLAFVARTDACIRKVDWFWIVFMKYWCLWIQGLCPFTIWVWLSKQVTIYVQLLAAQCSLDDIVVGHHCRHQGSATIGTPNYGIVEIHIM